MPAFSYSASRLVSSGQSGISRELPPKLAESMDLLLKHIQLQSNPRKMQLNLLELLEMMEVLRQLKFFTEGALQR